MPVARWCRKVFEPTPTWQIRFRRSSPEPPSILRKDRWWDNHPAHHDTAIAPAKAGPVAVQALETNPIRKYHGNFKLALYSQSPPEVKSN